MDFNFSKQERMLQDSVREFLKDKVIPEAAHSEPQGALPREKARGLLRQLVPFGCVGSLVPETAQGPGLSHVETGIVFFEMARAWASLAGVAAATSAVASALWRCENRALAGRFLAPLLRAEMLGCVAVTEAEAGSDVSALETTAVQEADTYVVNGTKTWVANGTVSDVVLLWATVRGPSSDEGAVGRFLVERNVSAFRAVEIPKMGLRALPTARLVFENCKVPAENLLAPPAKEPPSLQQAVDFEHCRCAAAATGIAQAALETAVAYARQRVQFGKRIGTFQMIQRLIAEMAVALDASMLLTFRALKRLDEGLPCRKEASMAKAHAAEAAVETASKSIQIHGAYGYSDECPVERYYRDARCFPIMEGTTQIQQLTVAEEILGLSALY